MRLTIEKSKKLRKQNMKPPENVTLIDLEGKPITNPLTSIKTITSLHIWVSYEDIDVSGELVETLAVLNASPYSFASRRGVVESIYKLSEFLNDQLTFIRNGMWETLAIYQATLGRYWEVPWYENSNEIWEEWSFQIDQRQHPTAMHWLSAEKEGEVFSFRFDGFKFAGSDSKKRPYLLFMTDQPFKHEENVQMPSPSLVYPKFVKYFTKIKPSSELFLKHYPDVFSKLTPYEGATS
jgi:hypothetical protein